MSQRTKICFAIAGIVLVALAVQAADYFQVRIVKRVDDDLYLSSSGYYIQTEYCYHYTYGEDAVIKWEGPYSYDNKIIWEDGTSCRIKSIWKKNGY